MTLTSTRQVVLELDGWTEDDMRMLRQMLELAERMTPTQRLRAAKELIDLVLYAEALE